MGVLTEKWCFCKGVGKSERMQAAIFSGKGSAMARISGGAGTQVPGTGFLIHRNLLLTTHVNIPSVTAAESLEIRIHNGVAATLAPHRFFITSSVLDLTIVGLDAAADGDSNGQGQLQQHQPHFLKTCPKPNLDLGSVVYFLGYLEKEELSVGEGKVVIATDNLVKLSTDGITWRTGSAGFDAQGNLSFMICDPMKLATSPNTNKSSSTSSSSSSSCNKRDSPKQFGIPIPIICDWLNQHWEGSLDELTKPKLPIIKLMSAGQKSEHSCTSFSLRQVFKSPEAEQDKTPAVASSSSSKNVAAASTGNGNEENTNTSSDPNATAAHVQGIPTPEIYESARLTAFPVRKKETGHKQLLDINFPPKIAKADRKLLPSNCDEKSYVGQSSPNGHCSPEAEISSTGSVNGGKSEVQSSSSPVEGPELHNNNNSNTGYSSEGETTMYSAETAESRNYTSPREGKFQQVGRSQSCVSYNRWTTTVQRKPMPRRTMLEQQRSFIHGRKMSSQGATSQRSNDYFSPTVSSVMKNRSSAEPPVRQRKPQGPAVTVHSSPRWMF
ncbi:unnamed protein product [Linum trigynum]|uniref:Uncharacterized protein n=1 Tax=Linum trigynum TaxID=586398 RepID=A0AAV2GRV6_9ROSI